MRRKHTTQNSCSDPLLFNDPWAAALSAPGGMTGQGTGQHKLRALAVLQRPNGERVYINDNELAREFLKSSPDVSADDVDLANRASKVTASLAAHKVVDVASGSVHHNLGTSLAAVRPHLRRQEYRALRRLQRESNGAKHVWNRPDATPHNYRILSDSDGTIEETILCPDVLPATTTCEMASQTFHTLANTAVLPMPVVPDTRPDTQNLCKAFDAIEEVVALLRLDAGHGSCSSSESEDANLLCALCASAAIANAKLMVFLCDVILMSDPTVRCDGRAESEPASACVSHLDHLHWLHHWRLRFFSHIFQFDNLCYDLQSDAGIFITFRHLRRGYEEADEVAALSHEGELRPWDDSLLGSSKDVPPSRRSRSSPCRCMPWIGR